MYNIISELLCGYTLLMASMHLSACGQDEKVTHHPLPRHITPRKVRHIADCTRRTIWRFENLKHLVSEDCIVQFVGRPPFDYAVTYVAYKRVIYHTAPPLEDQYYSWNNIYSDAFGVFFPSSSFPGSHLNIYNNRRERWCLSHLAYSSTCSCY
jgi:hypothetical protein